MADLDGSTWPNHIKADAVGPNATLNFFRANGMDTLVDGYGLHFYPSPYKHGDAAGPVAMLAHIQLNGLLECRPTGSGKRKPAWITEWGFNTAYSGCPVNDSVRTMLVTDIRNEFKTYVQQGRIKGIFFYTWQGTYHAIKEDYSSAFRCGKLTNSGKIAISPM